VGAQPVEPVPAAVACPLCGFGYVPGGETCRERGCPVAFGGCATRHCPRCGYTMPDEERSVASRLVRLLFKPRARRTPGHLAELPGRGVPGRAGGAEGRQHGLHRLVEG